MSDYHLEAGIAACHSTAPDDTSTNCPRILALYDRLLTLTSSPIAASGKLEKQTSDGVHATTSLFNPWGQHEMRVVG